MKEKEEDERFNYFKNEMANKSPEDDMEDDEDYTPTSKKPTSQKSNTPVLDNFGRDLTKNAEEGKLDPIVGREKELERVSQILSRRKKNNPILIGEPGCVKDDTIITVRKVSNDGFHNIIIVEKTD